MTLNLQIISEVQKRLILSKSKEDLEAGTLLYMNMGSAAHLH